MHDLLTTTAAPAPPPAPPGVYDAAPAAEDTQTCPSMSAVARQGLQPANTPTMAQLLACYERLAKAIRDQPALDINAGHGDDPRLAQGAYDDSI